MDEDTNSEPVGTEPVLDKNGHCRDCPPCTGHHYGHCPRHPFLNTRDDQLLRIADSLDNIAASLATIAVHIGILTRTGLPIYTNEYPVEVRKRS